MYRANKGFNEEKYMVGCLQICMTLDLKGAMQQNVWNEQWQFNL